MKWIPDTHDIEFEIDKTGVLSMETKDPEYMGRDLQTVFDEVVLEHKAINERCVNEKREQIMSKEEAKTLIRNGK